MFFFFFLVKRIYFRNQELAIGVELLHNICYKKDQRGHALKDKTTPQSKSLRYKNHVEGIQLSWPEH